MLADESAVRWRDRLGHGVLGHKMLDPHGFTRSIRPGEVAYDRQHFPRQCWLSQPLVAAGVLAVNRLLDRKVRLEIPVPVRP